MNGFWGCNFFLGKPKCPVHQVYCSELFLRLLCEILYMQVCRFLEVSKLSFAPEYGPKLKEDYIMVKHLPKIMDNDDDIKCCSCQWFCCCRDNWQKVWSFFCAFLSGQFGIVDVITLEIFTFLLTKFLILSNSYVKEIKKLLLIGADKYRVFVPNTKFRSKLIITCCSLVLPCQHVWLTSKQVSAVDHFFFNKSQ